MSGFQKMALVDHAEWERIMARKQDKALAEYNPELRAASNIQGKIDRLLESTGVGNLSDEEKLLLFNRLQSQLRGLVPKMIQEAPIIPQPQLEQDEGPEQGIKQESDFPKAEKQRSGTKQRKTKPKIKMTETNAAREAAVRDIIKAHPELLRKSKKKEIIISNRVIPGSNFEDLLRFLFPPAMATRRPALNLYGADQFLDVLASLPIPPHLIGNKEFAKKLRRAQEQTGSGMPWRPGLIPSYFLTRASPPPLVVHNIYR